MYELTSTEIKKGVLCTDWCIHHLRKENAAIPPINFHQFKKELDAHTPPTIEYKWHKYPIKITNGAAYSININSKWHSFSCISIDPLNSALAFIADDELAQHRGKENNILHIFQYDKKLIEISSVSKEVVIYNGYVFYIGEHNEGFHHYTSLYAYKIEGGTSKRIFDRKDQSHTLHLAADKNGLPFLAISTYDAAPMVHRIKIENGVIGLQRALMAYYIGNEADYASIVYEKPHQYAITSNGVYVIEIAKGISILKYKNKKILEIPGWIDPLKTGFDDFLVSPIDRPAFLLSKVAPNRNPSISIVHEKYRVPIISVEMPGHSAEKTLIVFYGAYGLRTRTIYPPQYWAPLLTRGWRICYVLARGGGDNGLHWAMQGRKSYHKSTIDDAVNAIKWIRETYQCPWDKTAIYARSAGGIPAGIVTLMGLVGISFMEHPFVDIIETMSNPALPLTAVEYGEFGNPAMRGVKEKLVEVSPMDCIRCVSPAGAPKTRVLMRTGERDTQVYPYEPLKFAGRLRELGHEVFLASEKGEGHFYGGDAWLEGRARDLVILNSWADGEKISGRDIKMAKTHRNKNSQRNKNKNKNSKRNKNMEGGKRRKSRKASRRTRRRVGRKH